MAVIDTLKLARALRENGGFTEKAAEATAEAINTALGEQMASKADLEQATERLEHRIDQGIGRIDNRLDRAVDKLTARLNFTQWQIGIVAALQIATLVELFVHG
jgi:hypothetical protein